MLIQRIRKRYYKTLGTSVINNVTSIHDFCWLPYQDKVTFCTPAKQKDDLSMDVQAFYFQVVKIADFKGLRG